MKIHLLLIILQIVNCEFFNSPTQYKSLLDTNYQYYPLNFYDNLGYVGYYYYPVTSLDKFGLFLVSGFNKFSNYYPPGQSYYNTIINGLNDVLLYNISTNQWSATQMKSSVILPTAISLQNRGLAFFAGGLFNYSNNNNGNIFNPSNIVNIFNGSHWTIGYLSQAKVSMGSATFEELELVFFIGGQGSVASATNIIDIYNARTNTWITSQLTLSFFQLVTYAVSLQKTKQLFFIGYYNELYIYNYTNNVWYSVNINFSPLGIASFDKFNQVYLIVVNNLQYSIIVYDALTGTFSKLITPFSGNINSIYAINSKNLLLVSVPNYLFIYDLDKNQWFNQTQLTDYVLKQFYYSNSATLDSYGITLNVESNSSVYFFGNCSAGYYQTTVPLQCNTVKNAYYAIPSAVNQTICPAGYYCPTTNQTPMNCPPGFYCPNEGLNYPIICPSGTYCPFIGTINYLQCPLGYYCPQNTSNPIPCPTGTISTSASSSNCSICPGGYTCSTTATVLNCQNCGGFQCTCASQCNGGNYCPPGSINQLVCPAGTYTYNGMSYCLPCPAGYYCQSSGTSTPYQCGPGQYCPLNSTNPMNCQLEHILLQVDFLRLVNV